jgi:hypothetical protein
MHIFICIVAMVISLAAGRVSADEGPYAYQLGATLSNHFFGEQNYLDRDTGNFDRDNAYNLLRLSPELSVSAWNHWSAYALADADWTHYWLPFDDNELELRLVNAYGGYARGAVTVEAGLMPLLFGNGLILASDEPAVSVEYEVSRSVSFHVSGGQVMSASPMMSVGLTYRLGFMEKIDIYGVWFNDQDDSFAAMLDRLMPVDDLSSSGNLFWLGMSSEVFAGPLYLSCTALAEYGDMTLGWGDRRAQFDIRAYLVDLEAGYNFSESVSADVFCFLASGDSRPLRGDLYTFVSPLPYNSRTGIFFNPDFLDYYKLKDRYQVNMLSPGGMTMAGVVAPGIKVEYQPFPMVIIDAVAATFFPQDKPADGRDWYGWEGDLRLTLNISDTKQILLEFDSFQHGNYATSALGGKPDPAYRLLGGFYVHF